MNNAELFERTIDITDRLGIEHAAAASSVVQLPDESGCFAEAPGFDVANVITELGYEPHPEVFKLWLQVVNESYLHSFSQAVEILHRP